jgi:beta-N-acetylhexosaminidase
VLRFSHAFRDDPRALLRDRMTLGAKFGIRKAAAVTTLLLMMIVEGCAVTAETAGAARKPPRPLPVAELLLVGFGGTQVEGNEELQTLVCDIKVGGLILFERQGGTGEPRNILGPEQVHQLTSELQALAMKCAGRPLFIAADNEGGLVMRLSPRVGYLPTPAPRALGEAGDVAATELEARRMAATLREAGINWNLAPVVDVAVNPLNPAVVTLGRTFSADPERVIAHARAFILGMHEAGILTSLKHFPGHGSSQRDSHAGFTDVTETADLDAELLPYRLLIKEGLADSVMTAHVFNKGLDPWDPATLSRYTVNRILRNRFGYKGVIVSDDLLMGAIIKHYGLEEAAAKALNAGVDILLISGNMPKAEVYGAERVVLAINRAVTMGLLSRKRVLEAVAHVDTLRARLPR